MTSTLRNTLCGAAALAVLAVAPALRAQTYINEVLFDPPDGAGGDNSPNEYIELRGTPGTTIGAGSYLVSVEGDRGSVRTPGALRDIFDLEGFSFGSNGFLVLLQNGTPYLSNGSANTLTNSIGSGFGNQDGSTVGHRSEGAQVNLRNPSVTFLLINSATEPDADDDVDAAGGVDDGTLDGPAAAWTILDSVGILDDDPNPIGYGAINFFNPDGTGATSRTGPLVSTGGFNPSYIGRVGDSTGSTANDWVAADLDGTPPDLRLAGSDVTYSALADAPLNHIGASNPVPEPAALAVLGLALPMLLRRRAR